VPKTRVIVAASKPPDLSAEGICRVIRNRSSEMVLVENRIVDPAEVDLLLGRLPSSEPCALILVGPFHKMDEMARDAFDASINLVALVTIGETVQIWTRGHGLPQLIEALQQLASPVIEDAGEPSGDGSEVLELYPSATLLRAATKWVHALLREATGRIISTPEEGSYQAQSIQVKDWAEAHDGSRAACTKLRLDDDSLVEAEAELSKALESSRKSSEPLARLNWALELEPFDFRLAVLALGPELDVRYQNWIILLMNDQSRRVGTLGLYGELLGIPEQIATGVARSDRLARWRVFDTGRDILPPADAPLVLDAPLRAWLLGDPDALQHDPSLDGMLRDQPWPGAHLVADETRSRAIVERLVDDAQWVILAGDGGPAAWRALLEGGAKACSLRPVRADLRSVGSLSAADSWDAGVRLARMARLQGRPLMLDASTVAEGPDADAAIAALLAAAGAAGQVQGAIIAVDPARMCRLLGSQAFRIEKETPSPETRLKALRRAAERAGATFTEEAAESLANLYPLQVDGIEQAMRIALARPLGSEPDASRARFITACKEVSAEGASGLAQRIEPIFELTDVVLPPDRLGQLDEIVDNIRFAPKVLEGWRFRDQLPYGLGVTALFHGPSGTGKTMASMAVAKALGVQILKIDLSRVVSKYIGDTEKNIDRVFQEAQLSGAALVIDEADGLLARRSEVKDAHDRYANLEVAYLLQRMEAFEGLAILTTNLRQNLDSAFLRRLRFIVDFPRPDAAAREEIWRRCLPPESHELDDATFRLLGRRIELTGGSIRQITLRAAFLAAAGGERIGPAQVAHAARAEFAKLGLPPVELDLVDAKAAA
jgi:hypothetical protein